MNYWQGDRIRLRGVEPEDAEHFIVWNQNSERGRMLDFLWPPISEASVREWVQELSKQKLDNDGFHWIIENEAGLPVGSIIAKTETHNCHARYGTFTYSVDIAPEHHRKGYASEAILLVLKYYFEELRFQKVITQVHSDNEPSLNLHKKLGFVHEGTQRRMLFSKGEYVDLVWFGMTVEEFEEKHG